MFKFLKRILGGAGYSSKFSGEGRVYHLLDPFNNRLKKCVFIEARISTTATDLILENLAYSGEQEDLPGLTLPINSAMALTRYTLNDEDEVSHGFKFNNLNEDTKDVFGILSIEFDREPAAEEFAIVLGFTFHCVKCDPASYSAGDAYKYIEIEESTSVSSPLTPRQLSKLTKTGLCLPSNLHLENNPAPDSDPDDGQRLESVVAIQTIFDQISHLYREDQILYHSQAELREYTLDLHRLETRLENSLLLLIRNQEHQYSLDIVSESEIAMRTVVTAEFQYQVMDRRLMWVHRSADSVECWVAVLQEPVEKLSPLLARVLFDAVNLQSISQMYDEEETDWVLGTTANIEGEETEPLTRCDLGTRLSAAMMTESLSEFSQHGDSLLLAKETEFSVLRERASQFHTELKLPEVTGLSGTQLHPRNLLPCVRTENVLFLSDRSNAIFDLNLERGKIVQEWKLDTQINAICLQDRIRADQIIGINAKSVFSVDRRTAKNPISAIKGYVSTPGFSAVFSPAAGGVCACTSRGEIKLFKTVGQNAKTNFPGLGDAILSVDVTDDGRWVLGTTKTYLLLLNVTSGDQTGFQTRLGKHKKYPRKLTLLPTDIAKHQIPHLNFTPAKFNRDSEDFIVTSTGAFLVIWDFGEVKRKMETSSFLTCYQVFPMERPVVQTEFKQGEASELVMADSTEIQLRNVKVT